jgi:hypothetical protein
MGSLQHKTDQIQTIIIALCLKEGARPLGLSNMLLYMATKQRSILFKRKGYKPIIIILS